MRTNSIIRLASFVLLGLALTVAAAPSPAAGSPQVAIGVVITTPPPDLPVYDQPFCPGENYIWVPGYWAWDVDFDDYYWVPGTWVLAPEPGFLWTPGYWSWNGASFVWINGYWGPVVGFYGGVHYGFGYFGTGYVGGHWDHDRFYYNRSVTRVNETVVHNVYNTTVVNNYTTVNRVSYNGGNGGITARPTAEQEAVMRERHVGPVSAQTKQMKEARSNRELWSSVNQGRPPIAATQKPAEFKSSNVVAAREAGTVYGNAAAGNRENPNRVQPNRQAQPAPNERPNQTVPQEQRQNQQNPRMNEQQSKQERTQQKQQEKMEREQQMQQQRDQQMQQQQMRQQREQQNQENMRMNEQRANQERQQQQMQREREQQNQQMQREERPRQEQRQAEPPQHEQQAPPQQQNREHKEKKSDER